VRLLQICTSDVQTLLANHIKLASWNQLVDKCVRCLLSYVLRRIHLSRIIGKWPLSFRLLIVDEWIDHGILDTCWFKHPVLPQWSQKSRHYCTTSGLLNWRVRVREEGRALIGPWSCRRCVFGGWLLKLLTLQVCLRPAWNDGRCWSFASIWHLKGSTTHLALLARCASLIQINIDGVWNVRWCCQQHILLSLHGSVKRHDVAFVVIRSIHLAMGMSFPLAVKTLLARLE